MALIFGAPLSVPAGRAAFKQSIGVALSLICPITFDVICITCEYFSTIIISSTDTVEGFETFETSFLARSTNIICSAFSLSSPIKSILFCKSSDSSIPLLRVPAIGLIVTLS